MDMKKMLLLYAGAGVAIFAVIMVIMLLVS